MKIQLTGPALPGRYFHLKWALRLPLREKVHMDTPLTGLCESEHDPGTSYQPRACLCDARDVTQPTWTLFPYVSSAIPIIPRSLD